MAKQPFEITDEIIFEKVRSIEDQFAGSIPETVFHYTNTASFMGIIQARALWASGAEFLNDESEFRYGVDICNSQIENLEKANRKYAEIMKLFRASMEFTTNSPFVVCFCQDGDLLSQWRGYSSHGQGLSVGLRSKELKKLNLPYLNSIVYDRGSQSKFLFDTVKAIADAFLTVGLGPTDEGVNYQISGHAGILERFCGLVKDGAFREEAELRLAVPDFRVGANKIEVKFRARNNLAVPYIEIDLSPIWDNVIQEVIVGPGPDPMLRKKSIEHLLSLSGLQSVDVRLSNCQYRQ
jgi:hypothetical protein